jgi:hypothetical protein
MKLLTRKEFKEKVFNRDGNKCVICKGPGVDAHHIIDRKLFHDGGYYLDNGVCVCSECHLQAEQSIINCNQLRCAASIVNIVLPEGTDPNFIYDKWGTPIDYA